MKLLSLPKWNKAQSGFEFVEEEENIPRDILGAETYPEVRGDLEIGSDIMRRAHALGLEEFVNLSMKIM